ncbi:Protein CUTL-5, partial [Aphelenchoides avenae]
MRNLQLLAAFTYAKYPNEIVDTPIVTCEPDRVVVKVKTSAANPSHIYAEDFHEASSCMVRNMNTIGIALGECGMTTERMESPQGTMYRICIAVQIHPLFVTDSDRSYCAQCVYMDANVIDDLEQSIAISEPTPNELEPQFDGASNPQCSYSIRKGAVDGPEVHAAVVGETVYHVWQCNNDGVGLLVQNCHVEDLAGDKILIIDQQGCGVDQYLFKTPEYRDDLQMAFLESNVFKFVDKSMTRFRCQLRLCMKNRGHGCESITPPNSCPVLAEESTEPQPQPEIGPSTPISGPPVDSPQPHGPPGFSGSTAAAAAVQKPAPEVATVAPIIGPPSIRPFG